MRINDDPMSSAKASASGIAECLRMLADEAASLRMVRTLMAVLEAAEICLAEEAASGTHGDPSDRGSGTLLLN